jgi:predicted SAM-dependent methyltransferase
MKQQLDRKLKKLEKINVGCGWDKREGYLNIDVDAKTYPDVLVVGNDYSIIPKYHYTEILANDVLEHISHTQTLSVLLDWSECLKDNGKLHLQTSSILGVAAQLKLKPKFVDQIGWTCCLFGNQAHEGDFHHVGFTEATLKVHLLAAGYAIDSFSIHNQWLFFVDCHKTFDWTSLIRDNDKKNDSEFIVALYKTVLGREPDWMGEQHIKQGLASNSLTRSLTRRDAVKHVFQSRERLYYIAEQANL